MKIRHYLPFILSPVLFLNSASAQEFSYDYIQISLSQSEYDDVDLDLDGKSISGSINLSENNFLFGSLGTTDFDNWLVPSVGEIDGDADSWSIGLGFHTPLSDKVDFVATGSYTSIEGDGYGYEIDENVTGVSIGVRAWLTDSVEFDVGISHSEADDADGLSLNAGFIFPITESLSLGVGGSYGKDTTGVSIGGRYSF